MKKRLWMALAVTISFLSACTPPTWFISKENNGAYADRQQLVFTHLWQRGATGYKEINGLINEFNESEIAKELNVFVKGDGINFWDYWDKVNLSISGGSAPDIFIHAVSSTPTRLPYLLDLTDMYESDVESSRETLNSEEMFYPSQIGDITRYAMNGHMYAWPFSATVRVVYYNKTMFEEAGITDVPSTWAEMEEASRKLTKYNTEGNEKSGYKTIGFDPFTAEGQYIHQWGWLAGHDYWSTNPSNGRPVPNFNDPTYVDNLNILYNSYVRRDKTARDNLQNFMAQFSLNNTNPFVSGKVGMMISNEGLYTTLKEAKVDFDYSVFEIPPMNNTLESTNWSSSYSLELYDNRKRNVSDEIAAQRNRGAWEFMKFLYGEKAQGVIADAGFMLSNRTYYDRYIYVDPLKRELTKAIEHTREAEYIAAVPNWTSDIQVYVNNIYSNTMTVKEAMDAAQALMQAKIEQYYSVNKN